MRRVRGEQDRIKEKAKLTVVCSGSEDEVLKRLLELKELYKVQRDELGGVCLIFTLTLSQYALRSASPRPTTTHTLLLSFVPTLSDYSTLPLSSLSLFSLSLLSLFSLSSLSLPPLPLIVHLYIYFVGEYTQESLRTSIFFRAFSPGLTITLEKV
jgi:hypothetical protein